MTKRFQTLLSISTCAATTCPTDDCSDATDFFVYNRTEMKSLASDNQTFNTMMANTTYKAGPYTRPLFSST